MTAHHHAESPENKADNRPAPPGAAASRRRSLRVWVVDSDYAVGELLLTLLHKQPGIRCTRQFTSAATLLQSLDQERPPDTILLDLNLGSEGGLAAIRPIKKLAPRVQVLVMTMFSDSDGEAEFTPGSTAEFRRLRPRELPRVGDATPTAVARAGRRARSRSSTAARRVD